MALHRRLNQAGFGGNFTTWRLIQTLLDAGWVMTASGSGTAGTYEAAGNVFDMAGLNPLTGAAAAAVGVGGVSGSEPWGYGRCWCLMTSPDGTQWCWQRDTGLLDSDDDEWAIAYDPAGAFALGPATASVAPISASMEAIQGTLNATWPAQTFQPGVTPTICHVAADDVPSADGSYGFICIEMVAPNTISSVWMVDDLASVPDGGLFAAHPVAIFFVPAGAAATSLNSPALSGGTNSDTEIDYGGGTEAWESVCYHKVADSTGNLYPGAAGAPATGEVPVPIFVGKRTHGGFAGLSRWLEWTAISRGYPDESTDQLRWYISDVMVKGLPDGATTPTALP